MITIPREIKYCVVWGVQLESYVLVLAILCFYETTMHHRISLRFESLF